MPKHVLNLLIKNLLLFKVVLTIERWFWRLQIRLDLRSGKKEAKNNLEATDQWFRKPDRRHSKEDRRRNPR